MEQEKDSKRDMVRPKRDQQMDALHAEETITSPTAPKEEEEKEEHEPSRRPTTMDGPKSASQEE